MSHHALKFVDVPTMPGSTLLLALTGWMDGGFVSTGTVKQIMVDRPLIEVAEILPGGFYIDNFPGSMEVTAMFRPHAKHMGGLVTSFDMTPNIFVADTPANMLFFIGREPNLNWPAFADCILDVVKRVGCERIIFMGSFGGTVPHTREPRMFGSASAPHLLPLLKSNDLTPSDYEGPSSFATYLLTLAPRHNVEMLSIAAEIPGYLQGVNPLSIEAVTRRLARMLDLHIDFGAMRQTSTAWELRVTDAVAKDDELAATVRKLEEQYDNLLIGIPPPEEDEGEEGEDDDTIGDGGDDEEDESEETRP